VLESAIKRRQGLFGAGRLTQPHHSVGPPTPG